MSALRTIKTWLRELLRKDDGQDLIEYTLLAAAVVIVVAGFLPTQLMPSVSTIFSKITSCMAIS